MPTTEIEPMIVSQPQQAEPDRELIALLLPLLNRMPSFFDMHVKAEPASMQILKASLLHALAVARQNEMAADYWLQAVTEYAQKLGKDN